MLGEALEQNSVSLLELREKERRHWSSLVTTLQSVILGVNVAIWAFLLKAYIDTSKLEFISIASCLSAITLGVWHFYSRYFSSQSTDLYTEIIHYESTLGVPEDEGLQGILSKHIPVLREKIFQNKELNNAQKLKAIQLLIQNKSLGGSEGNFLDWELLPPLLGFIALNTYFFTLSIRTGHTWLFGICFLGALAGLALWMIGYSRFQRNTTAKSIDAVLADLDRPVKIKEKKTNGKQGANILKKIKLLPLITGAASVIVVLLFILWIISAGKSGPDGGAFTTMAIITILAVALAAFCIFFYMKSTTVITREMKQMREMDFEMNHKPRIIVDFEPNANGLYYLTIANEGNGAARNVQVSINPPLKNSKGQDVRNFSALDKGVHYFTSKKKLVYVFDSASEISKYESLGLNRTFMVNVEYDWEMEGRPRIAESYPIELTPLADTQVSSYKDTRTLIDEVEKIRLIFEKMPTE